MTSGDRVRCLAIARPLARISQTAVLGAVLTLVLLGAMAQHRHAYAAQVLVG